MNLQIETGYYQLSPFMMEQFNTLDLTHPSLQWRTYEATKIFIQYIDLLIELGNQEHANDWDPYLIIRFNDGREQLETNFGYYSMDLNPDGQLIIEDFTDKEIEHILDLRIIHSITIKA